MPDAGRRLDLARITRSGAAADRREGRGGRAPRRGRRRHALPNARPARRRHDGRSRRTARRHGRSRHLRREPAHQPDQRLHPAQDVRLLLVRAAAQGRGRVPLHDGSGVRRGGAANPYVARVPHRRRARHEGGARVLRRDVPRAQGAPSRRCTSRRSPRSRSRTSRASRRCPSTRCSSRCARRGSTRCPAAAPRCSARRARDDRREEARRPRTGSTSTASRTRSASARTARCSTATSRRSRIASSTSTMLRDLQDETGGFLAYIPLAYHPDNNELGDRARPPGHRHHRLRRPAQPRRRPAVPRQLRARQDALDHGDAVPVADGAARSA